MKEICELCPKCGNTPERQVNKVFIKKETSCTDGQKIGDLTKEAIEENREILKDFQESLKNEEFTNTDNISS